MQIVSPSSDHDRAAAASPKKDSQRQRSKTRAKVSNGTVLIDGVDRRSALYRRFRDLHNTLAAEVAEVTGLDGPQSLSEVQRQFVRRAALLSVMAEHHEQVAISGAPSDPEYYIGICRELRRVLVQLGIRAKPQDDDAEAASALDSYLNREAGDDEAA